MKPMQLILIAIALVCALGAGLLMMNMGDEPAPKVAKKKKPPVTRVLIANKKIAMGSSLGAENLKWEKWPKDTVRESYITQKANPKAIEEYKKAIARSGFFAGEPIRDAKIVHTDSGYLSAILPAGKRAMAIPVRATSSAGGFVLPNDNVDVILNYRMKPEGGGPTKLITEVILQNIRVLAVDRLIEEKEGKKAKVGRTITLELTAQQTEIVAAARATGSLTLALRSVEDADLDPADAGDHLLSSGGKRAKGTVRVIRYGATSEVRPKK
ncbi:MAG: Flp pilus assembly protein CpaB [Pseudomonadota bacterium]